MRISNNSDHAMKVFLVSFDILLFCLAGFVAFVYYGQSETMMKIFINWSIGTMCGLRVVVESMIWYKFGIDKAYRIGRLDRMDYPFIVSMIMAYVVFGLVKLLNH